MRTTRVILPAAIAAILALSACSDGDDAAAGDDVASLGGDDAGGDATGDDAPSGGGAGGGQPDPEFQDAMVEYAECMRAEGIDFPDPVFREDGMVVIGGGGGEGDPGSVEPPSEAEMAAMEEAAEVCQPILDDVEGALPQLDPEQEQEMRDQALAFAECMREQGIDYPDPVFGESGEMTVAIDETGDGPSFDDPDFQAAAEACGQEGGFSTHPIGGER